MSRRLMAAFAALIAAGAWAIPPASADEIKTDAGGFIPYWIGIGNIPYGAAKTETEALDRDYVGGEAALHPLPGQAVTIDGTAYTWRTVSADNGSPILYGNTAWGDADSVLMYLAAYVEIDHPEPSASILWGSDDSGKLFVNGKQVGRYAGDRGCDLDEEVADIVPLHKGINTILFKVVNGTGPYGGCIRLVDAQGRPLAGLPLRLAPDGEKPPAGAGWNPVDTGQAARPGPLGASIVASQLGYDRSEQKMAIGGYRVGKGFTAIDLRSAVTNKPVFVIPRDGGAILSSHRWKELNLRTCQILFGSFRKPGRYYLATPDGLVRSKPFSIQDDVFTPLARIVSRAMYFQRMGQRLFPRFAGAWASPAYHDPAVSAHAKVYQYHGGGPIQLSDSVSDPTSRDVGCGWYDSDSPNEYTRNEAQAQNWLLLTYDMNRARMKGVSLNIPESGTGVPDLVSEAAVGARFLLHMQRSDGALFDRIIRPDDPALPPRIAEPCSGSTLCGAASLAWAGAVWKEGGWNPTFAQTLIDGAEKAWRYCSIHTGQWPRTPEGWPRVIGSVDGGYGDERGWRMLAAACLFRATGDEEYREPVEEYLSHLQNIKIGGNSLQLQACHNYALSRGSQPEVVAAFGRKLAPDAAIVCSDTLPTGRTHPYGAGSRDGYAPGSNGVVARTGAELAWYAWRFASPKERSSDLQAAREYLQYLLGRNPTGYCFVTSLQGIGVVNSVRTMKHFLVRSQDRWWAPDGTANRLGCFPGFLVAGPSDTIDEFSVDAGNPEDDHLAPSIVSQGALICLAWAAVD